MKKVFHGMFARLMTVMLAAILACVLVLYSLFYFTIRADHIDARMNELKRQAYDIAYLASRVRNNSIAESFGHSSTTETYIKWKANSIYSDFNAYSVVVDRTGKTTLYATPELMNEEDMIFDQQKIVSILSCVLRGEEIIFRTQSGGKPMFTVAVPWMDNGTVLGAVFIQTAAQTVYATYSGFALQVFAAALATCALATVGVFFMTRQIIAPLRVMVQMAGEMAQGKFDRRVPISGSSETRELAAAFNSMAAQLEALEQTRRDFVANVSHELRSPMTSMQGFLQGMLDGTIPVGEQKQYMQIVLDETRRQSKLVGNLLNLSRMENSNTELAYSDFDLHECIRRVIIANMSQLDDKRMDLQLSFEDEPMYVHADADQIEQVLVNLLSNAVKYTPEGGHIAIDTAQEGKLTRVVVRDDGPGVAPEDAPYIFDRFYKADKAHTVGKGTGLGLAICKRIMDKHGQSLRLLDTKEGAAFEFTLESGRAPEALPHAEEKDADPGKRQD